MKAQQNRIKAVRIVNGDFKNPHYISIDSEKELEVIKAEKSIKHLILTEDEFKVLEKENLDNQSLVERLKELEAENAALKSGQSSGKKDEKDYRKELFDKAAELGIDVPKNIKTDLLEQKIAEAETIKNNQ